MKANLVCSPANAASSIYDRRSYLAHATHDVVTGAYDVFLPLTLGSQGSTPKPEAEEVRLGGAAEIKNGCS